MSQSPFGEPPPGTDLSDNHRGRNDAALITTYALAGIAVSLRFYTRSRVQQVTLAADDWMILAALVRNPQAEYSTCKKQRIKIESMLIPLCSFLLPGALFRQ